jgi:hypothetical protein
MIARTQPVAVTWFATLVAVLAAKYLPGLRLDDAQALYIAGAVFTIGSWATRRIVTPTARPRAADGMALIRAADGMAQSSNARPAESPPPSRIADERPQSPPRRPTG